MRAAHSRESDAQAGRMQDAGGGMCMAIGRQIEG